MFVFIKGKEAIEGRGFDILIKLLYDPRRMLGDDELGEVAERLVTTWRQVLLTSKRFGGHLMENLLSPSLSWRQM